MEKRKACIIREKHAETKSAQNGKKQAEGKITLKPKGKVCRREKHRK